MPSETFAMNVFDEEAILDDDVDRVICLALLAESALTLDEARAYLAWREKGVKAS